MKAEIQKAVETQLETYPESTLMDIYKSFFQDEFGPGHLLENPEDAADYLKHELETMESRGRRKMEACGTGRNFCRIPLDLIIDGLISEEAYLSAFLSGATDFRMPAVEKWKEKWNVILKIIMQQQYPIKDFAKDSDRLMEILERGNYVMHHSRRYNHAYAPHYRIFSIQSRSFLNLADTYQNLHPRGI